MIRPKLHHRERQYRPLAGKTLRQVLIRFVSREFPRLGGPWVVELFVDKLLEIMAKYRIAPEQLRPGQTLWPAIALDERPAYRKPTSAMRQVPVVITLANQDDVRDLRNNVKLTDVLKRALARAAHEAFAQGGVLTSTDLALLFHRSHSWTADLIRQYEDETGQVVPRRGNIHDIGRTVTHKRTICRMAYVEGKPTHHISQETRHSPEAVDNYILDFARVHFATVKRGMTLEETAFAIQRPLYLVNEYANLIQEFGMDEQRIYDRAGIELVRFKDAGEEPEALPRPAAMALDST
ncbi:MAG: DUF1670 domain-containing protein [Anaerolineales bacterium]